MQVLVTGARDKLPQVGPITLDGTKINANASKQQGTVLGHANKIEAQLRREAGAGRGDRAAAPDGMDVPAEIARREDRLSAIARAKAKDRAAAAEATKASSRATRPRPQSAKLSAQPAKAARQRPRATARAGPKDGDQVNLTG